MSDESQSFLIQPNSKLVMIGDSITDCGRQRPVAQGSSDALGTGYVNLVDALLMVRYPAHQIGVVNMGIGGNTVRDLRDRWQTDVMDLAPDWLSICIGINDVWRNFSVPAHPEAHVPLDEYTQTLEALVKMTRPTLKGLVLMTPYFIEPDQAEPMRAMMDRYGDVVRGLADQYQAYFVDTQAAFDAVMAHLHPMALAADRVHPNRRGHLILAQAFLNAVGYDWG